MENWIISGHFDLPEEFSTFFEDTVRSLNAVQAIKQNILVNQDFYFCITEVSDILKETTAINNKRNGTFGNIPTKILKEVSDICAPALNDIWDNEIITHKNFS